VDVPVLDVLRVDVPGVDVLVLGLLVLGLLVLGLLVLGSRSPGANAFCVRSAPGRCAGVTGVNRLWPEASSSLDRWAGGAGDGACSLRPAARR